MNKLIQCNICNLLIEWPHIQLHLLKVHSNVSLKCMEHDTEFKTYIDLQDHLIKEHLGL